MTVSSINQASHVSKTLSYSNDHGTKNLGGAGGADPALSQWYEQAYAYYNAVQSGAEARPEASEWNAFLDQMNWAYGQLQGTGESWGDEFDMEMNPVDPSDAEGFGGMGEASDPFGGVEGSRGNLVYTDSETRLGFIGEERPMDVWSTDFTLDVSSGAAKVVMEETTDTRFNPAEQVYKITVTDRATGKTSVYFLHDIAELSKIQINTPGGQDVDDKTGKATIGEYEKPSELDPNAPQESNAPIREEGDYNIVEVPVGSEAVQLAPQAGAEGDVQKWKIWADFQMTLLPSDTVNFVKNPDGTVTIEVTHSNQSKDILEIQKGFEGNVNALEDNVTGLTGIDNITLNVEMAEDVEVRGDQPTRMDGEDRIYDVQEGDVSIYPVPEGKNRETYVDVNGKVTITPNSTGEYFTVSFKEGPPKQFVIEVYPNSARNPEELKETLYVDADLADELQLLAHSSRVKLDDSIPTDEIGAKLKIGSGEDQSSASGWPTNDVLKDSIPYNMMDKGHMQKMIDLMEAAMAASDSTSAWEEVKKHINGTSKKYMNDTIRGLLHALNTIAGDDTEKFQAMIKMIPPGVRKAMAESLLYTKETKTTNIITHEETTTSQVLVYEAGEQGDAMFTNQQVYDLLNSLTE